MAVLLLAEVTNGELAMDATAKAVTAAKAIGADDQRGGRFRQAVAQRCIFGDQNLGHAVDGGGGVTGGGGGGAGAQNGDVTDGLGV